MPKKKFELDLDNPADALKFIDVATADYNPGSGSLYYQLSSCDGGSP